MVSHRWLGRFERWQNNWIVALLQQLLRKQPIPQSRGPRAGSAICCSAEAIRHGRHGNSYTALFAGDFPRSREHSLTAIDDSGVSAAALFRRGCERLCRRVDDRFRRDGGAAGRIDSLHALFGDDFAGRIR